VVPVGAEITLECWDWDKLSSDGAPQTPRHATAWMREMACRRADFLLVAACVCVRVRVRADFMGQAVITITPEIAEVGTHRMWLQLQGRGNKKENVSGAVRRHVTHTHDTHTHTRRMPSCSCSRCWCGGTRGDG